METLKSILIAFVLFVIVFGIVMLFLIATDQGNSILAYVAGFIAWIIINLGCVL